MMDCGVFARSGAFGRKVKESRGHECLVVLALLMALCGCDESTDVSQKGTAPGGASHRTIAFTSGGSLSIVTFDDPESPRQVELLTPEMGFTRVSAAWSFDGRRLTAVTRGEDLNQRTGFLFSSENWAAPIQPVSSFSEKLSSLLWIDSDRYLEMDVGQWALSNLSTGQSARATASQIESNQWPGDRGYSYLIRHDETFDWIHPAREPVTMQSTSVASFRPTTEGSDLILVYEGENEPDVSDKSHLWNIRALPQPGCTPSSSEDCLPSLLGAERIPQTSLVLISTYAQGIEGAWHSILVREFGETTSLPTGPNEPGVLRAWGPESTEYCSPALVSDRVWVHCSDKDRAQLERFEMTPDGPRSAYSVTLDTPGGATVFPYADKGALFSQIPTEDGSYPETWRMLDLRRDAEEWQPVELEGEMMIALGRRGAIFIDALGDPFDSSIPCAPCSFTAVEDILDPKSPRLTGSFVASTAPAYRDSRFTFWPAPDGSGVLTLENGTWYYETFATPGTRFPIATPPEGALLHLPPSWGE